VLIYEQLEHLTQEVHNKHVVAILSSLLKIHIKKFQDYMNSVQKKMYYVYLKFINCTYYYIYEKTKQRTLSSTTHKNKNLISNQAQHSAMTEIKMHFQSNFTI
jgi:hypothetical protein